jgi:hypothetical protein
MRGQAFLCKYNRLRNTNEFAVILPFELSGNRNYLGSAARRPGISPKTKRTSSASMTPGMPPFQSAAVRVVSCHDRAGSHVVDRLVPSWHLVEAMRPAPVLVDCVVGSDVILPPRIVGAAAGPRTAEEKKDHLRRWAAPGRLVGARVDRRPRLNLGHIPGPALVVVADPMRLVGSDKPRFLAPTHPGRSQPGRNSRASP